MKTIYLNQISKKFKSIKNLPTWLKDFMDISDQVKLVRAALGMTQIDLAKRIGYKKNVPVADLENKIETNPTIEKLKKYAEALECNLLIRFVPKQEITKRLDILAEKKAREIVSISTGSSALELQRPDKRTIENEVKRVKKEILEKRRSVLWKN